MATQLSADRLAPPFGFNAISSFVAPPCSLWFGPSPCPLHYDGRLATMTSADFCPTTLNVSARRAAWIAVGFCGLPTSFGMALNQTPIAIRLPLGQISPDKNMNFPCATAPFTVSPEPMDFVVLCQLVPEISAFYGVSVRQLAVLPLASYACGRLRQRSLPRGNALALS